MNSPASILADFRSQVTKLLHEREQEWEASRRLVGSGQLAQTIQRLLEQAQRADIPTLVRDCIGIALNQGSVGRIQDLPGPRLKELTGLPPTKALRALCVWFDLVQPPAPSTPSPLIDPAVIEGALAPGANPFDMLLSSPAPSLLDLGAGDLTLVSEVADLYAPRVAQSGRTLTVHAIDRLDPRSRLGGPLHPEPARLQQLRARPDLSFQFYGDQDMFDLDRLDWSGKLLRPYDMVTCWAPATPTFAYEPTRLSESLIDQDLRRTKGCFQRAEYQGEPALEVLHGDRALLFPPWKFDIRGPLALLDLISQRGRLCVLGAVDGQVFWEVLAQLLEDARFRQSEQPFTAENLPLLFGEIFERLTNLPVGDGIMLSHCGPLRRALPRILKPRTDESYRFREVVIRRGALFPGFPTSSTARRFRDMVEETPPWMLVLAPER